MPRAILIITFIWALGLGLPTVTRAIAQVSSVSQPSQPPGPIYSCPSQDPRAIRLALERFQLAKRIEARLNRWPIDEMIGDYEDTVLFPEGRADRAYVIFPNRVYCFQQKRGKTLLAYQARLEFHNRIATKSEEFERISQFANLMDYLTAKRTAGQGDKAIVFYTTVVGSKSIIKDLSITRDYAHYDYDFIDDCLLVCLLSDFQNGRRPDINTGRLQAYPLSIDPFTKDKLSEPHDVDDTAFYKRYGLPVANGELHLIIQSEKS